MMRLSSFVLVALAACLLVASTDAAPLQGLRRLDVFGNPPPPAPIPAAGPVEQRGTQNAVETVPPQQGLIPTAAPPVPGTSQTAPTTFPLPYTDPSDSSPQPTVATSNPVPDAAPFSESNPAPTSVPEAASPASVPAPAPTEGTGGTPAPSGANNDSGAASSPPNETSTSTPTPTFVSNLPVNPPQTETSTVAPGGDNSSSAVTPAPGPTQIEGTPFPTDALVDNAPANDDGEYGNYEDIIVLSPTEAPITYVAVDDDPVKKESTGANWPQAGESPEQMMHDRNVLIAVGVICGFAVLLMIVTAQQMLENPDGCCAGVCRLLVGCTCCLFRTICFPCRAICCGGKRGRHHQMLENNSFSHDLELS